MRYPLLFLPTLLPFFVAILMSMQSTGSPAADRPAMRAAQIREMHQQLDMTEAKLLILEAEEHKFLPR